MWLSTYRASRLAFRVFKIFFIALARLIKATGYSHVYNYQAGESTQYYARGVYVYAHTCAQINAKYASK